MSALKWPPQTQTIKFDVLHRITCPNCGMEQYTANVHNHIFAAIITLCPRCGGRELQLTCPDGCDGLENAEREPRAEASETASRYSDAAVSPSKLSMPSGSPATTREGTT